MRQPPRSLVLITVDCMRADHVGFLGYERPTTPFLDSLAGESLIFRNAITAGAPTYYSLPAMLASRYPLALGRDVLGIAPDESTITSVLKDCGFQTAAFLAANPYLSPRFGYQQGFEVFRDLLDAGLEFSLETVEPTKQVAQPALRTRANRALSRACHTLPGAGRVYDDLYFQYCQKLGATGRQSFESLRRFPSADVIVDHAAAWLSQNSNTPFFLWLHLMDPHSPYYPKQQALDELGCGEITAADARYLNSYWARGDVSENRLQKKRDRLVALYDAGIRWADAQIRRLTEKLVDLNIWDKCALAVTADHGEHFLEHGQRFHPPVKLTEELIRVPLLLRVPDLTKGVYSSPLGLIDLAPTLLDILNIPAPASFRGRSCWNYVTNDQPWDRVVVSECVREGTNPFYAANRMGSRILAMRMGSFKLVLDFGEAGTAEQLFDLATDPHEHNPLPLNYALTVRRHLLQCAKKHLSESQKLPDVEPRLYSQLRDMRLEWAQSTAGASN